jgi:hypothetical protein
MGLRPVSSVVYSKLTVSSAMIEIANPDPRSASIDVGPTGTETVSGIVEIPEDVIPAQLATGPHPVMRGCHKFDVALFDL